jgi:hypothetical protein
MADDARISTALPKHFKTLKLKRRLGAPGCWSLVCLFLWVAENKPSGDLTGMSDEEIEIVGQWEGELGAFAAELVSVGFLDGDDGARTVHDWQEHNPWAFYRPQRVENAKKAIAIRWGKKPPESEPDTSSNTGSIRGVIPTSPLLSSPHLTTENQKQRARPSFEEVAAYCQERGNRIEARAWFDHYESNGWKVGKNAMKDWRACVRTWERNGYGKQQAASTGQQGRIERTRRAVAQGFGINEHPEYNGADVTDGIDTGSGPLVEARPRTLPH